jgi:hypothetical protein
MRPHRVALQVQGPVGNAAKPPRSGTVSSRDAIIAVRLTNVRSKQGSALKEIVGYLCRPLFASSPW